MAIEPMNAPSQLPKKNKLLFLLFIYVFIFFKLCFGFCKIKTN